MSSSEATRAVGSTEGKACSEARPYRPQADKQRSHEDHEGCLSVGAEKLCLYRPQANKEGDRVIRRLQCS